jgi:hypothetical protein
MDHHKLKNKNQKYYLVYIVVLVEVLKVNKIMEVVKVMMNSYFLIVNFLQKMKINIYSNHIKRVKEINQIS